MSILFSEAVYQVKRWQVVWYRSVVQVSGQPHRPNEWRLWRPATGEVVWAPENEVKICD